MNADLNIYLASGSPRRKDLLEAADIPFKPISIDVEEVYPSDMSSRDVASYLARLKAEEALEKIEAGIVITADTIVIRDGVILEKPADPDHAFSMIRSLAGGVHEVVTGVCLYSKTRKEVFDACTKVWLHPVTDEEIRYYIDRYRPFDKAGAYGIQEWIGWTMIHRIEGSYANVMGLPIDAVYHRLVSRFGYSPLD